MLIIHTFAVTLWSDYKQVVTRECNHCGNQIEETLAKLSKAYVAIEL